MCTCLYRITFCIFPFFLWFCSFLLCLCYSKLAVYICVDGIVSEVGTRLLSSFEVCDKGYQISHETLCYSPLEFSMVLKFPITKAFIYFIDNLLGILLY